MVTSEFWGVKGKIISRDSVDIDTNFSIGKAYCIIKYGFSFNIQYLNLRYIENIYVLNVGIIIVLISFFSVFL